MVSLRFAAGTTQAEAAHQATDPVTSDGDVLAPELAPDLVGTVNAEVVLVHSRDLWL